MATSGITLRPAIAEDLPAIVEVINANSLDVLGIKQALIDTRGRLRTLHDVPPEAERIVAVTDDGRVIAFLYFINESPYIIIEIGGAVHPDYRRRGIGTMMLEWAEQRAREQLFLAPAGAKVVLYCNIFESDDRARGLLTEVGYAPAREWLHLEIELAGPPPPPVWPEGIRVRLLDPSRDWPAVRAALEEAFADHWGQVRITEATPEEENKAEIAAEALDGEGADEDDPYFNSRAFCFVALHSEEVVGACLGNARSIEWPDSGKVGSLSVRRGYRRKGIGAALMLHAFGEFYRHGIRRVITDTDADSFTGSYRVYQRVGMRVYRRECLYEKEMRPGKELRLLAPEKYSI
jgi:GNAT superfamily N-acetyltransferase